MVSDTICTETEQEAAMAGSYKSSKLEKRPDSGPADVEFSGKMTTSIGRKTGKAGSFSDKGTAYSLSPGSGPKPKRTK